MPKKLGMKGRIVHRIVMKRSDHCLQVWRSGWYRMWQWAPELLTRWRVPRPGHWPKDNPFGGQLFSTPQEFRASHLTGQRIARVLEAAAEKGATQATLRLISKVGSYMYLCATSTEKKNFPIVNTAFNSLDLSQCGETKSTKPVNIMTPEEQKAAYARNWTPEDDLSLVEFEQGLVGFHDLNTLGNRATEDLNRVKKSTDHRFDLRPGFVSWSTGLVGGRAKLQGHAKGKREWRNWRICMCPNGKHISPDPNMEFDEHGNPVEPLPEDLCTTCPVVAGQILMNLQPDEDFRIWRKWSKDGEFGKNNEGNVVLMAHHFLVQQGVMTWYSPFCRNSGRKALALLCTEVHAVHHEGVHVYGDNADIWRKYYMPSLPDTDYTGRDQATDYLCATALLRKFRTYFGKDAPAPVLPADLDPTAQALLILAEQTGCYKKVFDVYNT